MTEPTPPKKSDLGVRAASAVVMVAVAGTALWLGGWVWTAFVALVALGVLWEWWGLVSVITVKATARLVWVLAGLIYVSIAAMTLVEFREPYDGVFSVGQLLLAIIGVDVGAYFAGRSIGGPKIAPSISPSKTWAGLMGGAIGGALLLFASGWAWPAGLCRTYVNATNPMTIPSFDDRCHLWVPDYTVAWEYLVLGILVAIVAQAGDFFESWMKRRAGVKDSSNLIPGHGGLFDRADGLIAVCFVTGVIQFVVFVLEHRQ